MLAFILSHNAVIKPTYGERDTVITVVLCVCVRTHLSVRIRPDLNFYIYGWNSKWSGTIICYPKWVDVQFECYL